MAGRLLLLSCSRRKRADPSLLPAIDRYDGPAFRVLRRYLRSGPLDSPDTFVLSAEFGLIPDQRPIPYHDRQMTAARARELERDTVAELRRLLANVRYREVFISLGRSYLAALGGSDCLSSLGATPKIATGPPGKRLAQLRDWLYGELRDRAAVRLEVRTGRTGGPQTLA